MSWTKSVMCGFGVLMVAVAPVAAQGPGYPELSKDEEMRLALSAGPLSVSTGADIYLMTNRGFERVTEGDNGFACLVVRSAQNKSQLAPHCLNSYAVESVLPAFLREAELQAKGMSADDINAELSRQWGGGELPLPSGPAYAYMMSEGQVLGPNGGNFRPHFMLYMPYVTNEDIGGDPQNMALPFVGPYENHPLSTVVILMEEFVSLPSIPLPARR